MTENLNMSKGRRYLLQVDSVKALDLAALRQLLEPAGIELDLGYRPITLDAARGRVVARVWATDEARRRAEALPGVRFFADPAVEQEK